MVLRSVNVSPCPMGPEAGQLHMKPEHMRAEAEKEL